VIVNCCDGATCKRNSNRIGASSDGKCVSTSCGAAPADSVQGFPAIDCGIADFDEILDARRGFYNLKKLSDVEAFNPGINFPPEENFLRRDPADVTRHANTKRWSPELPDWLKKVGEVGAALPAKIKDLGSQLGDAIQGASQDFVSVVKEGVENAEQFVGGAVIPGFENGLAQFLSQNPSISGAAPVNFGPKQDKGISRRLPKTYTPSLTLRV
jgi:hypothetical protein